MKTQDVLTKQLVSDYEKQVTGLLVDSETEFNRDCVLRLLRLAFTEGLVFGMQSAFSEVCSQFAIKKFVKGV